MYGLSLIPPIMLGYLLGLACNSKALKHTGVIGILALLLLTCLYLRLASFNSTQKLIHLIKDHKVVNLNLPECGIENLALLIVRNLLP